MNRKKRRLFYMAGVPFFFLIILLSVLNSNNDDLAPGTREGIEKGKRSTQELKDEVYTRNDANITAVEPTSILDILPIRLTTIIVILVGFNILFVVFRAFGRFRW